MLHKEGTTHAETATTPAADATAASPPTAIQPSPTATSTSKREGTTPGPDGEWRAYPSQMMVWHELVNDEITGLPISASHCPLCGSAIVFVREIETGSGRDAVEFGVSGKLYNSDLLMYDRMTDTYWSQLTGTAVVGELTG